MADNSTYPDHTQALLWNTENVANEAGVEAIELDFAVQQERKYDKPQCPFQSVH